MTSKRVREVASVQLDGRSLQAAVDDFLVSGFDCSDIGVVAGRRSVVGRRSGEPNFDAVHDDVEDLMDDPEAPRTALIADPGQSRTGSLPGHLKNRVGLPRGAGRLAPSEPWRQLSRAGMNKA